MPKINFALSIFFGLFIAFLFMGNSAGRNGNWANFPALDDGFCGDCHTSVAAGSIQLIGAPTTYNPGQTYNMTISLFNSTALVGGFQLVATNGISNAMVGDFNPAAGTKLNNVSRLVQSTPKNFSGGAVSWDVSWIAPNAGAPGNIQFYFAGNAANGDMGNGSGDFGFSNFSPLIALPISLVDFSVEKINNEVLLEWTVDALENHSHFELQRSMDGKIFNTLDILSTETPFSASRKGYSYLDKSPERGMTNYYRLKSVDLDAQFSYSEIINTRIGDEQEIAIFPNPITKGQLLNIQIENYSVRSSYELQIISRDGQLLKSKQLNSSTATADLDQLAFGLYVIRLIKDGLPILTDRVMLAN